MRLSRFLGKEVSLLLNSPQYKSWPIKRVVDDDSVPQTVGYILSNGVLQVVCDRDSETIRSLFCSSEAHAGATLSEIPFCTVRSTVLLKYGTPAKSGDKHSHPILGDFGPWDRFELGDYVLHVEYCFEAPGVKRITMMRNDVAP